MAPLAWFSWTWVPFLALSLAVLNGAHYFTSPSVDFLPIGGHADGTCLLEVSSGVKVSLANVPQQMVASKNLFPPLGPRGQRAGGRH